MNFYLNFSILILHCTILNNCIHSFVTPEGLKNAKFNPPHPDESKEFWFKSAQDSILAKFAHKPIEKQAKNIIFFLGDGMGISTVTAARIYKGQLGGSDKGGEEASLHMDTFPYTGSSKTYCLDVTVADSACSATAYLSGTKANMLTIGVSPEVLYLNCTEQMKTENHVSSILHWSQMSGKSTGIVVKSKLTEASPAGNYAHSANRLWENNAFVERDGVDSDFCDDIAEQLILSEPGKNINVLLGGGRSQFLNSTTVDWEYGRNNYRTDGKDLIQEWKNSKNPQNSHFVQTRDELLNIDTQSTENVLGLFSYEPMEYVGEYGENSNDPNLSEMTRIAIEILQKNQNGFYLFVEGSRIDHAHHMNQAKRALGETLEFDEALKLADDMTDDEDTLIVVTSDHSHPFTIGGYPLRGHPIFHPLPQFNHPMVPDIGDDGLQFGMLGYANGPGYKYSEYSENLEKCIRYNISQDEGLYEQNDYQHVSQIPLPHATHSGEDVLIFAKGPFAHLLTGVNEQSFIPHVMGWAGCVGPFDHFCNHVSSASCISFKIKYFLVILLILKLLF